MHKQFAYKKTFSKIENPWVNKEDAVFMDLYSTNAALLQHTTMPFMVIANELGVSLSWLYRYKNRELGDPGVVKSERLYYLLTGRKLNLVAA